VFIPLIVVNCIILGRAEAFAYKNDVLSSFVDAAGSALGYGAALFLLAFIREILANQSLTLTNPFNVSQFMRLPLIESIKMPFFGSAPGAFVTLGLLVAGINAYVNYRSKRIASSKGSAVSAKTSNPSVSSKEGE
jgi:electron transport complex protein RnfE